MNSKTHMYVGAAVSLAVLQPVGIGNTLVSIAGGVLGGWLCDIDVNTKSDIGDYFAGIEMIVVIAIIAGMDYLLGFGVINYIIVNRSLLNAIGLGAFLLLGILGAKLPILNPHRTFMHSFLAVILFSASLALAFPPIVLPFATGMLLHILLDLTNKQGVQLLYPLGFRPCLKLCNSEGVADKVIRYLALASTIMLAVWCLAGGIVNSPSLPAIMDNAKHQISQLGLSYFQLYLIVINVIAFLFNCYDYQRYNHNLRIGKGETVFDVINTYVCNFLTVIGGALGMLISLIVCNLDTKLSWRDEKNVSIIRQGDNGNAWWFILVASALLAWIGIYVAVVNPFGLDYQRLVRFNPLEHLPLIGGYVLINMITFIAFWRDREHKRVRFDVIQFLLLLLCAVGGSLGGLMAIAITGKKEGSVHFAKGVPALLVTNAITIIILIVTGTA